MTSPYNARQHAPSITRRGVECSRCGMRKEWAGWREACSAPLNLTPAKGSPEHRAHLARVADWKRRNPDRVQATEQRRRA